MKSKKKYNFEDAINTFFLDCREMLDEMEKSLLEIEKDSTDEESINALFRAIHTIKGSSSMFGFETIENFTHVVETLLDEIRKGKVSSDPDLIAILLESHDYIECLVDLFEETRDGKPDNYMKETDNRLIQMLKSYMPSGSGDTKKATKDQEETTEENSDTHRAKNESWHISIRFGEDVFRNGLDPAPFINYLSEIGTIEHIVTITDGIPSINSIDPESCYFGLEIAFKCGCKKEEIEEVFEFLMDDCTIRIMPPNSNMSEYEELIQSLPEETSRIGEILTKIGVLTDSELQEALRLQKKATVSEDPEQKPLLGEIVVEEKMVQKPVINAALNQQVKIKQIEEKNKRSIRIDALKLDQLMNFVGELVITGASVRELSGKTEDTELIEAVSVMSRLIEDIRDSTMNVRMVQIGEIFRKFERLIRDLSREQNKNIELVIAGGETELDKTLIDKINDPLVHLIRNALDHGIDSPEERKAKGKPEVGTINLNAYHSTGCVVIEVTDDGDGLNREKIKEKAIAKGLLAEGQDIPDIELFQLIFEPGFSTADKITNISGRGVGMDVVKRNIQSIRGSIAITSKDGEGTSVKINLPLTLAIIDGFMVQVGNSRYVIPLEMVIECANFSRENLNENDAYNFINLRGEVLPFLLLKDLFKEEGDLNEKANIIIVEYSGKRIGLVVDKLLGEFQTVIKPLGKLFRQLRWTIGATILGTGQVALILDVPTLIQNATREREKKKYSGEAAIEENTRGESIEAGI